MPSDLDQISVFDLKSDHDLKLFHAPADGGMPEPPEETAVEMGRSSSSFKVYIRLRPPLKREKSKEGRVERSYRLETAELADGSQGRRITVRKEEREAKSFVFHEVFGEDTTQGRYSIVS